MLALVVASFAHLADFRRPHDPAGVGCLRQAARTAPDNNDGPHLRRVYVARPPTKWRA